MSEKITGLYPKLHAIQSAIMGLQKDKKGQNYAYVTGDKVLTHIKPLMTQYGLLLKQEVLSIENMRNDYRTGIGTANEKPKSEMLSKVMQRFTWVDVETGEKDENLFGANGQNDWDKGVGSALTYAERYFLLKFFHIATDQDDIDNKQGEEDGFETPLDAAIGNIRLMMTPEELVLFYNSQPPAIQKDKQFLTVMTARKSQLKSK